MKHYLQQPPEIQKALFDCPVDPEVSADHHAYDAATKYPFYVSQKFISEVGRRLAEHPPITPVLDHEAPQAYVIDKTYKELASLISLSSGILAVDDALMAIIKNLEPDVHQFFPIEIMMPRDKAYPKPYFTLVIGKYIDSLVPEKCKDGALRPNGPDRYFSDDSKKAITGRAFSQAIIGEAHLWRERHFRNGLNCFSDALQVEIESAGLLMPKHYKMIEV